LKKNEKYKIKKKKYKKTKIRKIFKNKK